MEKRDILHFNRTNRKGDFFFLNEERLKLNVHIHADVLVNQVQQAIRKVNRMLTFVARGFD